MAERGTYFAFRYNDLTALKLKKWCDSKDVPFHRARVDQLHSTILYSRKPVDNLPTFELINMPIIARPKELVAWDTVSSKFGLTKALVLTLDCPFFEELHNKFMSEGATYDFETYIPHITLSYNIGNTPLKSFGEFPKDMILEAVSSYHEELLP